MCFQVGAGDSASSVVLLEQFSFPVSLLGFLRGLLCCSQGSAWLPGWLGIASRVKSCHVNIFNTECVGFHLLHDTLCCPSCTIQHQSANSHVESTADIAATIRAATEKIQYDESWAADKNHGLSVYGDWVCRRCLRCLKRWQQIEVGFAASSHIAFRGFFCPCNDIWFSPHWEWRPSIGPCLPVCMWFMRWRYGLCAIGLTEDAFM